MSDETRVDAGAWGARFGWLAGGVAGVFAGFALTWLLESVVLAGRSDASVLATRASSPLVAGAFLAGALGGHAFGARSGPARYRALGIAAGLLAVALAWSLFVLTR